MKKIVSKIFVGVVACTLSITALSYAASQSGSRGCGRNFTGVVTSASTGRVSHRPPGNAFSERTYFNGNGAMRSTYAKRAGGGDWQVTATGTIRTASAWCDSGTP